MAQLIAESQYDPATLDEFKKHFWRPRRDVVNRLIERAIAEGSIRGDRDRRRDRRTHLRPDLLQAALQGRLVRPGHHAGRLRPRPRGHRDALTPGPRPMGYEPSEQPECPNPAPLPYGEAHRTLRSLPLGDPSAPCRPLERVPASSGLLEAVRGLRRCPARQWRAWRSTARSHGNACGRRTVPPLRCPARPRQR